MSIEVRPLGVKCNIACSYCYQHPQREAGNTHVPYSVPQMIEALKKEGGHFTVFGGEALLTPKPVLEELFKFGLETYGKNGIQTNGTLIDDEHVEIFKRYKTYVGFSMDGPGELNMTRWAGSEKKTLEYTEKSLSNLRRVLDAGLSAGLIVTLSQVNAGDDDRLARTLAWLQEVSSWGLNSIRIHVLEVDNNVARRTLALEKGRLIEVYLHLMDFVRAHPEVKLDVFSDLTRLMQGKDEDATCVWRGCDPYTTAAVRGVDGDGRQSNCGRTNKAGIDFLKADHAGYERSFSLYHTPQEFGGCEGCRFFLLCRGNCPGTAIDGDFRNRSEHCELWFALFERFEQHFIQKGETPFSLSADRELVEQEYLKLWMQGQNPTISEVRKRLPQHKFTVPVRAAEKDPSDPSGSLQTPLAEINPHPLFDPQAYAPKRDDIQVMDGFGGSQMEAMDMPVRKPELQLGEKTGQGLHHIWMEGARERVRRVTGNQVLNEHEQAKLVAFEYARLSNPMFEKQVQAARSEGLPDPKTPRYVLKVLGWTSLEDV